MTIVRQEPIGNEINNLDIKSFGKLLVLTDNEAITTLSGQNLYVRSGAEVMAYFT